MYQKEKKILRKLIIPLLQRHRERWKSIFQVAMSPDWRMFIWPSKKHQEFCFSALGILAKNYVFLQALERMHVKYYSADCTQIQ